MRRVTLCSVVNEDSPFFAASPTDQTNVPIFEEGGSLADLAGQTWSFLQQVHEGENVLQRAAAAVDSAGILEPWPVIIQQSEVLPDGTEIAEQQLEGLLRINDKAFGDLDDVAFSELRTTSSIALAHTQILSTHHMNDLVVRYRETAKLERQEVEKPNVLSGSDSLDIDWSKI